MRPALRCCTVIAALLAVCLAGPGRAESPRIAYITPSLELSFWQYVDTGVRAAAAVAGYTVTTLDSHNDDALQLSNARDAIASGVSGLVLSPTTSTAAPAVLALAEQAHIPVVICDIGTSSGRYASFVASDNLRGARGIGRVAANVVKQRGWEAGSFGIIGIPQARKNGQLRSEGFRTEMRETGLSREVPLREMHDFTAAESFGFAADMLHANDDLHVIFVEADDQALAVAAAVAAVHREKEVLIAAFDGTPELLKLITDGTILGAGMQQPYLMGGTSMRFLADALRGEAPPKLELIPVLTVTTATALSRLDQIKLNVFANRL